MEIVCEVRIWLAWKARAEMVRVETVTASKAFDINRMMN